MSLISDGVIEVSRNGASLKFTHRDRRGEPLRTLAKAGFMTGASWKQAMEDWLANFDETMPLIKPCGTRTTVGGFEEERL